MSKESVAALVLLEESDSDLKDRELLRQVFDPSIGAVQRGGVGCEVVRGGDAVDPTELKVDGHKICRVQVGLEAIERVPEILPCDVTLLLLLLLSAERTPAKSPP